MAPLILQLVASCVPIAEEAGNIIRKTFKEGTRREKDDYDFLAAQLSQRFIFSALQQQFSGLTLVAEEKTPQDVNKRLEDQHEPHLFDKPNERNSFTRIDRSILQKLCPPKLTHVAENQITVWIDSLDGINEFQDGLMDQVTVLIGIAVETEAVAGIIHQPFFDFQSERDSGRTVWGIPDIGTYGYSKRKLPTNKWVVTTSRNHDRLIEKAVSSSNIDEVIRVGGLGYKALLLLESKAHALIFASPKSRRWDTCAPEAILRAAGGQLSDIFGNPYFYGRNTTSVNSKGILATSKKEHRDLFSAMIPESVKKELLNA